MQSVTVDRSKLASPMAPPHCTYDPDADICTVVALINAGITDSAVATDLRMFLLGISVVNPIMGGSVGFAPSMLLTLYTYIELKHSNKSHTAHNCIFRMYYWYLSCCCQDHIREGVLQWISDYLISPTVEI